MEKLTSNQSEQNGKKVAAGTGFAILMGLLGHFIWGFGNMFMRVAMNYATASVMLGYRFTLAFILMNLWLIIGKKKISFKGKDIKALIVFVCIEPVCFFLQTYAILLTNTTCTGMIMAITPLTAMLLAIIFLKEFPTKGQLVFCLLPIVGVILITVAGKSLGVITPLGAAVLFVYAFSSGSYKTANRGAAKNFTAFERTYMLIFGCFVVYAIYALIETGCDWQVLAEPLKHSGFIWSEIAMATLCSMVANTMVNYSAKTVSVTKMATFGSVMTLTSVFAGVVLLHEPFNALLFVGAVLIIVGVWQVSIRGK